MEPPVEVGLMGRRKKVYSVNFNSLNDMILYAYGKEKKINNKKDTERLLFEIKERIAKDKIDSFRKKHNCKECFLFNDKDCKAECYCRFDKQRRLRHNSKINGCPHNNNEPCCYANESGTCFGYCYKKQMNSEKNTDQKGLERSDG